jgi:hypothetical protein
LSRNAAIQAAAISWLQRMPVSTGRIAASSSDGQCPLWAARVKDDDFGANVNRFGRAFGKRAQTGF